MKFKGLEFFGVYEIVNDGNSDNGGSYTQTGGELLYRFGGKEQLFIGGRLNGVNGNQTENAGDVKISRQNYAFGWYMSDNIILKMEYVTRETHG
ncbi:MAG: hypothetical protein U5K54_11755 [Cytophagales bacterium]|nr:hypothetical protein [Cytophagales bacterium]